MMINSIAINIENSQDLEDVVDDLGYLGIRINEKDYKGYSHLIIRLDAITGRYGLTNTVGNFYKDSFNRLGYLMTSSMFSEYEEESVDLEVLFEALNQDLGFYNNKNKVVLQPGAPIQNTWKDAEESMNFIKNNYNNEEMIKHDGLGMLEGESPTEDSRHWTSERYIQEAQSRMITHLMNQLKAHKKDELEAIDHSCKVLSSLTLDLWNK